MLTTDEINVHVKALSGPQIADTYEAQQRVSALFGVLIHDIRRIADALTLMSHPMQQFPPADRNGAI